MTEAVREIEISIDLLKEKVARAEMLERLEKNPDFKAFILEDFCEKHALGLVTKRVAPNFQDEKNRFYMEGQLSAIGNLKLYMQFVKQEGDIAVHSIEAAEAEKDRALEESEG